MSKQKLRRHRVTVAGKVISDIGVNVKMYKFLPPSVVL